MEIHLANRQSDRILLLFHANYTYYAKRKHGMNKQKDSPWHDNIGVVISCENEFLILSKYNGDMYRERFTVL